MKRQTLLKSTLCLLMALVCNVAWAQTPTKPEAFLTVSDLDDSKISYPHALSDDQAALVFGKDVLTIAVEVTTPSSMSVRGALVCAADPAKGANTASPTPYIAVGLHKDRRYTYMTSPVDGQQYSSSSGVVVNNSTRYKLIYVLGNGDGYNICKIYKYENGTLTSVLNRGRDNNNESATWIQGFKNTEASFPGSNLYIGGGVTSAGDSDVFTGLVHSVQFFDGALTDDEIKLIEYPETEAMKALTDAATANTSMNVYALQRYLGLVQNAGTGLEGNGQIKCNFPAATSQESGNAYANLIDGNFNTFFHSGYNNNAANTLGDGSAHYLQADLGKAVKSFRFYTKKRNLNNNNNRPTKITIEGSDDAEVWQPVTIVEGIPTTFDDFYSAEITSATAYKHYRFTVNTTSTSSVFFTFSEFYILPNTPKVAATFDAVRAYRDGATVATATALNEMYAWNTELSSSMPKAGKDYYFYADTKQSNNTYVARYLYNNNGALATSQQLVIDNKYAWTASQPAGTEYFTFQNVGDNTKYLGYGNSGSGLTVNTTAVQLDIKPSYAVHAGSVGVQRIGNDSNGKWMVTKADGTSFNRNSSKSNDGSWCSDYVFVPADLYEGIASFTISGSADATASFNGETKALPATFNIAKTTANAEVTIAVGNEDYTFAGLYEYGSSDNLGATYTFAPQGHRLFTVEYTFNLISEDFADAVPVQIYNDNNNGYGIKLNATADYVGKAVNSGTIAHKENEQWYLVGSESNFKMYSRTAGEAYAVKVAGTGAGSAATMVAVADATPLQLKAMEDGSYRIAPASSTNANVSFNMYGGAGADIKLHDGDGSEWRFRRMPKNPLTVNVVVEGEQPLPTNTRVAELSYNNASGTHIITKDTENLVMYVPFGDVALTQPWLYRGYTFDGFYIGEATTPTDFNGVALTDEGLTITAKYSIDADNDYQYLYWYRSEDINAPYRIPAITATRSGKILAISDYRPCGDDIGMGEVDIMFRRSTATYDAWDKKSWTDMDYVADGQGGNENVFNVGFGDAAVVSDRESNKTLVMAVAGRVRFTNSTTTNHPKVARIVTENDGDDWTITDVTDQFIKDDDEKSLFHGFCAAFITSGRIMQSATYKAPGAQYYRIYAVAAVDDNGDNTFLNHALYSDDFGETWKFLGGSRNAAMCCDAGNETTIEELPNGDLVVSVRKSGGRYFNVFSYGTGEDDKANGIGEWEIKAGDTKVTSNFGSADCNGELLRVGNVLLHSHPEGGVPNKARSNVAIYYKVIDPEKDYTTAEIATGWAELTQVSTMGSAYSTMTLLPDGKTVGFLYEEDPDNGTFAYCIVYKPIDLTELLTAEAQKEAFVVNSTIGQYEIGTFYANDAMVVPEGVTAYVATAEPEMDDEDVQGNATGTITMTKVEDGIIPAKTGALICGEPGTYVFKLADTEGETDVTNSLMHGYAGIYEYEDVTLESGYTTYVLTVKDGKAGFYRKNASFKVYNNKAYLNVPGAAGARALYFEFDNGATGIVETENDSEKAEIYDLTGRRVQKVQKGLYIVNGKKELK